MPAIRQALQFRIHHRLLCRPRHGSPAYPHPYPRWQAGCRRIAADITRHLRTKILELLEVFQERTPPDCGGRKSLRRGSLTTHWRGDCANSDPAGRAQGRATRDRPAFTRKVLSFSTVLIALLVGSPASPAQAAWPERPITLIVPFAPGGPTDIIARILATSLHMSLGQPVIIDNRAGAAGNTGMGVAAHATPDGYTLLLTSTSIAVNPALFKNLPYDPFRDFVPVSELVNAPNVLIVKSSSTIKTLADLVAQAKANPDRFNYSSPGAGTKSHLTGELLKLRAGIQMVHVPYRGAGPATLAVLEGTVQVGSVALPPAEPLIKDGQLRALAVTGAQRWFSLPDVPTMIESGYPNFVSDTFNALFAPAGTPPDIVAKLVKESRAAFDNPLAREQARKAGFEIVAGTPEQLSARVAAEVPAVRDLVTRAGIKAQ
jgi:tripartite-type tricarboxylate transporter receptor subunit TctC